MAVTIAFQATREITFVVNGETVSETQTEWNDWLDIPFNSPEGQSIVVAPDPIQAFIDHVIGLQLTTTEAVFAEDDIFCEKAPIAHEEVDLSKQIAEEVKSWCAARIARGFTVTLVGI